jgi:hypothetical protein
VSDFEQSSAKKEARRTMPGRPWTPQEESRRDALRRYLAAVAAEIQAEVESLVARHLLDPRAVQVAVENGVVTMSGRAEKAVVPELLASVRDIDDVVDVIDETETG